MNIFFLNLDPKKAAEMHVDKHVVKMIVEHLQMLCTTHHILGSQNKEFKPPYKKTHPKHPCNLWLQKSLSNYLFLIKFTEELLSEYTYRYGKIHKCQSYIQNMKDNLPNLEDIGLTVPLQAMPDIYKTDKTSFDDVIESYKQYYYFEKRHIFSWKKREIPDFIKEYDAIFN